MHTRIARDSKETTGQEPGSRLTGRRSLLALALGGGTLAATSVLGAFNPRKADAATRPSSGQQTVDSIRDLRALPTFGLDPHALVHVVGYHPGSYQGGGSFYWAPQSTAPHNGGSVIGPDGHVGAGRWIRC